MREHLDVDAFRSSDQMVYRITEPATPPVFALGMTDEDLSDAVRLSEVDDGLNGILPLENMNLGTRVSRNLQIAIQSLLVSRAQFRLSYIHHV